MGCPALQVEKPFIEKKRMYRFPSMGNSGRVVVRAENLVPARPRPNVFVPNSFAFLYYYCYYYFGLRSYLDAALRA